VSFDNFKIVHPIIEKLEKEEIKENDAQEIDYESEKEEDGN
jgi:hypothetical protein